MSEENRWDEDLPEVNENVPTEEKPLDTFGNTDTGSAADNSTENIDMKCISRRQEIMREEVFHRRNLINRRQLMEAGTAALERRLQQPLPWQ